MAKKLQSNGTLEFHCLTLHSDCYFLRELGIPDSLKRFLHFFAFILASAAVSFAPAEVAPQIQRIEFVGGDTFLRFDGVPGRTYFVQESRPGGELKEWNWLPVMRAGNGAEISLPIDRSGSRKFFRLQFTDQPVPDGQTVETADFDGDGLSNLAEVSVHSTDPLNPDSDGDGLPDGWEIAHGINPLDNGALNPQNGASGLFQGSSTTNGQAHGQGVGSDPNSTLDDYDGDGEPNGNDADPHEKLIDWKRAPSVSYAVIDLNMEPLGNYPSPGGRPIVRAILNDAGAICREPDEVLDERTPAVWEGRSFPITWQTLGDYTGEGGEPKYFNEWSLGFTNTGEVFHGEHFDGVNGVQGIQSLTVRWNDVNAAPALFGAHPYEDRVKRLVQARFGHIAIDESLPSSSTISSNGFIVDTSGLNPPRLASFPFGSIAPYVSRTGKVLIEQQGQHRVNDVPTPTNFIFGLTADPHGNDLIVTTPSLLSSVVSTHRHRNGSWEKMPMPGIMDMNAAGTGITFPTSQIWANGATIQLDELLSESGWSEFKAEQINARGLILGSAKPDGGAAHKAVLLVPSVIEQYDFETTKTTDGIFTITPSDPRPEVDMQLAEAEVNASGQLEVRVTGTVRDQLSEVVDGQRISELRFSVNGEQVKAISLNYGAGQAPWTLTDSLNSFDETILITDPKPGGYEIRAETDANAAGNTGWDRVAAGLSREDDLTAPQEVFSQLSVVSPQNLSATTADVLSVYFGNRAPVLGDADFTETAANSLEFNGSLLIGETSTACTLRIKDFTASAGGISGHFSAELSYTPPGGQEIRIITSLAETGVGSQRFFPDGFQINAERNSVHAMPELGGSHGEDIQPLLMKVGVPEELASQTGFRILVNDVPHALKKFTYGGNDALYVVNNTADTRPKIFVPCVHALPAANLLPGCDLPGEYIRWEMEVGGETYLLNGTLVLPGTQTDDGEPPVAAAKSPEFFGASPPARWQQPGDEITFDDLVDAYEFIYTDTFSQTLLRVYRQQQHEISLEDVYGDYEFSYHSRPGTKSLIKIENDDEDVHPGIAAQYLWRGLTKALTIYSFRNAVAAALNEDSLEIDAITAYKAEVGPAAAEVGIAAAELYLSGIGIVNEPADWLLVVNDVSEGNYVSLVAALPFISRGLVTVTKGIRIENRAGQVLGRLDAESFPALRDAMATGKLETVGTVLDEYELSTFIGKLIAKDGSKIDFPKSQDGLKKNMKRRVPKPGDLFDAHHDFPWSEREWFARHGVNVNKPAFGRWVHKKDHDLWHEGAGGGEFHQFWYDFMAEEAASGSRKTILEILAKLEECRQRFPITVTE